ncbi:MAG: hypothetical protein ACOY3Y_01655 [Acidobacteriota bacterium]
MLAPEGSLSLAQEHLRVMLADAPVFRAWCAAADQAEALAHVYHEGLPAPPDGVEYSRDELESLRPYAVVFTAERAGFELLLSGIGETWDYNASGRLILRLRENCPEGFGDEPTSEAGLRWKNTLGGIMQDLAELSGGEGYLHVQRVRLEDGPYWPHPNLIPSEGLWLGADLSIEWRGI